MNYTLLAGGLSDTEAPDEIESGFESIEAAIDRAEYMQRCRFATQEPRFEYVIVAWRHADGTNEPVRRYLAYRDFFLRDIPDVPVSSPVSNIVPLPVRIASPIREDAA
jgi:hypothetical protein